MNHSSHQTQLRAIDRAILALFQQRVRLCESGSAQAATDHMLRGAGNDINAADIRELFDFLERACSDVGSDQGSNHCGHDSDQDGASRR